jgi:hypothetical protein
MIGRIVRTATTIATVTTQADAGTETGIEIKTTDEQLGAGVPTRLPPCPFNEF